jgi:hypothetical protein
MLNIFITTEVFKYWSKLYIYTNQFYDNEINKYLLKYMLY